MKAGKATDLFPRSYDKDPLHPVRRDIPPKGTNLTLTGVSPPQAKLPSKSVNISGTGFTPVTILTFNGVPQAFTFKSDTLLTATFTASVAGPYPVRVRDGITASDVFTFTFTP